MSTKFPRNFASSMLLGLPAAGLLSGACAFAQTPVFTPGNVVVAVEGCGVQGGTCTSTPNGTGTGAGNSSSGGYGDNQGAPLTLFQFSPNGTTSASYVNSLVLPQTRSNADMPFSGEYGSSSEATLQLSGSGQYLTIGGYGIKAAEFNANPGVYSSSSNTAPAALAQTGSLTGQSYTPVARVAALIDPYGNVNTSSDFYNIFSGNNPRSVYTLNGTSIYLSGQGTSGDATGGVFYSLLYATNNAPTAITGADGGSGATQDTRTVQIYNGTLYVSLDSKSGSTSRSFLGNLGNPPSTTLYNSGNGPTQVPFANNASTPVAVTSTGKLTLTASESNGINTGGQQINLSASNYFFANPYTLYIADSGSPKQTSATSLLGDGGLQKWVNTNTSGTGTWQLQYTISAGLNLIANTASNSADTSGTTGLFGLTGSVSGSNVLLYATNYTINDLDPTYLYGFTDVLASSAKPSTGFTLLATAPSDSNFKGVSLAPTLAAGSATLTSAPEGLAVSTAGTGCVPGSYVTPFTLVFTPGSACQLTTTANQSGASGSFTFSHWSDGFTSTTDNITAPTTSAIYNATFADSTTTSVTSVSPASVALGATSTFTATLADNGNSGSTPVGTVVFTDTVNGSSYNAGSATVNNGTASVTYTTAHAGTNTITAVFTPSNPSAYAVSADTTGQTLTVAQGALVPDGGSTFTVAQGGSTTLSVIIGYPGSVAPTGALTVTVNGSSAGLGSPSCVYKTNHLNCSYPYTDSLAPGTYTINFSQAADSNYTSTTGTDTLNVTGSNAQKHGKPGRNNLIRLY
jgi:hypothetical protein